jgi:hypothetical protein
MEVAVRRVMVPDRDGQDAAKISIIVRDKAEAAVTVHIIRAMAARVIIQDNVPVATNNLII